MTTCEKVVYLFSIKGKTMKNSPTQEKDNLETVISYPSKITTIIVPIGEDDPIKSIHGYLFKRTDYHRDSTKSVMYGIELTEDEYKWCLEKLANAKETDSGS
jgi:hypothetical protein